jgi:hypothetical protein
MPRIIVRNKKDKLLHKWIYPRHVEFEYQDVEQWIEDNKCDATLNIFGKSSTIPSRLDSIDFKIEEEANLFRLIFSHKLKFEEIK